MKYIRWILALLSWDGLLPLVVFAVPFVVKALLPGNRGALEIASILLPITAFVMRGAVGMRQFGNAERDGKLREVQRLAFFVAIAFLVMIECLSVLVHIMPAGTLTRTRSDLIVGVTLFAIYFGSMAFAMFPFRVRRTS